jgi:hypothetical protein
MAKSDQTAEDGSAEPIVTPEPMPAPTSNAKIADDALNAWAAEHAAKWDGTPAAQLITFYLTRLKEVLSSI